MLKRFGKATTRRVMTMQTKLKSGKPGMAMIG